MQRLLLALILLWPAFALPAGTISGRLLGPEGSPVAGARVFWTAYREEEETLADETQGVDPKVLGEGKTGADGKFRITLANESGPVSLWIRAAGQPEAMLPGPFDSGDTISLPDIELPAAEKVAGRVVDEKNQAVSGARVRLRSGGVLADSDAVFLAEARTGADGFFDAAHAPEGFRSLEVRAPGFVPLARALLGSGGEQRFILKSGGAVAGTVLDASGKPAPGAIVVCEQSAARTDGAGRYRLAGVPLGSRSVQAIWKDDYVARRDGVKVEGAAAAGAPLRLGRAASIEGTVIDEASRKPVGGARIAVRDPGLRFNRAPSRRSVRSDSRGRFRAGGLEAGRYTVEAVHEGYVASTIPNVAAGVSSPGSVAIALAPAASIAGHVLDEKKKPLAGVQVRIARDFSIRGMLRRGAAGRALAGERAAVTGPEGQFRLDGLSASRGLTVEATKTGFAPGRRAGIALEAGERVQNVVLTLTAGLSARGRVVDGKGQPVAGAEIRARRRAAGRGPGRFLLLGGPQNRPDGVSGQDGSFVLTGLEQGDYELSISRAGYASKTTSVAVKSPEQTTWPPIVLSAGVSVAGVVRDAQGAPVAGATVFLLGDAGRPQNTATGGDGGFRLSDLPAGKAVMLAVNAEGYAGARSSATPPAEGVVVVLSATGTIRGRVQDAASGEPIPEFTVTLMAGGRAGFGNFVMRGPGGAPGPQNFQSADGAFEVAGVPPGDWSVRASATSYRSGDVSGVSVAAGETKEDVVVSLKRGGALAGRVLDAGAGVPIANATVSWEPAGSAPGPAAMAARLLDGGGANVTTTDADGRFAFDGLPDGKVTLTATHPDYLEASRDADPSAGSEVQIPLGSGGSIAGLVVGGDGRTAIPGAQVRLDEEGDTGLGLSSQIASTDGGGAFHFDHLGAGRFRLTAQSDKGTSPPGEVILGENQRQDGVTLQVASGAILDGTVSGLPEGQLGNVRINASAVGYRDSATTDDSGRFTLRDVPTGVVTLTASTSFLQGRTTSKTVEVLDGTTEMPVAVVFQGNSRLSGRVTRGSSPLSGLFVVAMPDPPDGSGRYSGQTDANGEYALEGLNDGGYQVSVLGAGVSYRKLFTVSGATDGDIALPAATISGTVTDASSGEPIESATVQAETGQETQAQAVKRAVTDSSGAYAIADVDPGSYQVTARQSGYRMKTRSVAVETDPAMLDFRLEKGSGLSIRVADGLTGMPLGGVAALAFASNGSVAFQGTVALDSSGTGEIPSLAPGRYAVYVFSGGYAPRSIPSVDAPSPAPVPVAMTPGGSVEARSASGVTGRILDPAGAPYLLSAFRLDGVVTATPPVTVWQHLAPGSYTFVDLSAQPNQSYLFTVSEGQTTRLEIR
ncbi:MAG: carboxypeptidase regulatory-like domain-containing protein [Acidobacteriota bacterium]